MAENKDTLVNIGYILASGKVVSNQMKLYPTPRHCVNSLNKHHGTPTQALDLIADGPSAFSPKLYLFDSVEQFLAKTVGVPPYLFKEPKPGDIQAGKPSEWGGWYYAEDRPTN